MPVSTTTTSKLRAKSLGTSGSELKSRTPEEVSIEMMALRKELLQAKEEGNLLKCRMRKMEEDHTKKIKQLEKNLAAAKKESNESEKKRESSAESISVLRQKCQKLEQALKEQELAMKKVQNNSRPARPTELKGLVIAYNPKSNVARKSGTDTKDSGRTSAPGPSPAIANELSRLKESVRKLQVDNTRLQQQVKEKNEEIKQLKQQALRSKVSKPSMSGSSSAPSALGRRSVPASLNKTTPQTSEAKNGVTAVQTRQSHSTVHRVMRQSASSVTGTTTSTRQTKAVEKVTVSKRTSSVNKDSSKAPVWLQNGSKTMVIKARNGSKPAKGTAAAAPAPSGPVAAPIKSSPVESEKGVEHNGMDPRVVELQQNVAAKKIQRTWRDHQYKAQQNKPEPAADTKLHVIEAASIQEMEIEEDVELIQSVLRGHQERLEYVAMQEDGGNTSEMDLKQALSLVQASHKHIWNEHVPQEE